MPIQQCIYILRILKYYIRTIIKIDYFLIKQGLNKSAILWNESPNDLTIKRIVKSYLISSYFLNSNYNNVENKSKLFSFHFFVFKK